MSPGLAAFMASWIVSYLSGTISMFALVVRFVVLVVIVQSIKAVRIVITVFLFIASLCIRWRVLMGLGSYLSFDSLVKS